MAQQDLSVHELVSKIERNDIRLPEMQRQYVWSGTKVRDLLDSLYRGYPSGSILTWETDESVATRDFAVGQDSADHERQNYLLLLDGQQRLTSLSAILRGEAVYVKGRKTPIDVLFNLNHPEAPEVLTVIDNDEHNATDSIATEDTSEASEDELMKRFERLTFVVKTNKLAALPHWVSVTEVFKNHSDTPFLKKAGVTNMDDPNYDKYAARLKQLRDIKDYEYRVHILERSKSYEEVTEIFVRVNSLGVKLRSSDLALAQITAKWRNSLAIFQEFEKACAQRGFNLDIGIHIKNLIAFATGQSRFKSVSSLSPERLQKAWEESKKGMNFALNFLNSNMEIDSPALLSSPFLLITLAFYGHHKGYQLSVTEAQALRHWAMAANIKARYSRGSSETFLDQDLGAIRKGGGVDALLQTLKTQVGRVDVQPEDLTNRNSRSAYFKSMFLAFRQDGAKDWRDQLKISLSHSGIEHRLQFHHIFPQAMLFKAGVSKDLINDICNLAFISGKANRKISDKAPSMYLNGIDLKALQNQCIPTNKELWETDQYEDFLIARRTLIADRLNDLLNKDSK